MPITYLTTQSEEEVDIRKDHQDQLENTSDPMQAIKTQRARSSYQRYLVVVQYGPELSAGVVSHGGEDAREGGSVLSFLQPTAHLQLVHLLPQLRLPSPLGLALHLCLPEHPHPTKIEEMFWQHLFSQHLFDPHPSILAATTAPRFGQATLPIAAHLVVKVDRERAKWWSSWTVDPRQGSISKWVDVEALHDKAAQREEGEMGRNERQATIPLVVEVSTPKATDEPITSPMARPEPVIDALPFVVPSAPAMIEMEVPQLSPSPSPALGPTDLTDLDAVEYSLDERDYTPPDPPLMVHRGVSTTFRPGRARRTSLTIIIPRSPSVCSVATSWGPPTALSEPVSPSRLVMGEGQVWTPDIAMRYVESEYGSPVHSNLASPLRSPLQSDMERIESILSPVAKSVSSPVAPSTGGLVQLPILEEVDHHLPKSRSVHSPDIQETISFPIRDAPFTPHEVARSEEGSEVTTPVDRQDLVSRSISILKAKQQKEMQAMSSALLFRTPAPTAPSSPDKLPTATVIDTPKSQHPMETAPRVPEFPTTSKIDGMDARSQAEKHASLFSGTMFASVTSSPDPSLRDGLVSPTGLARMTPSHRVTASEEIIAPVAVPRLNRANTMINPSTSQAPPLQRIGLPPRGSRMSEVNGLTTMIPARPFTITPATPLPDIPTPPPRSTMYLSNDNGVSSRSVASATASSVSSVERTPPPKRPIKRISQSLSFFSVGAVDSRPPLNYPRNGLGSETEMTMVMGSRLSSRKIGYPNLVIYPPQVAPVPVDIGVSVVYPNMVIYPSVPSQASKTAKKLATIDIPVHHSSYPEIQVYAPIITPRQSSLAANLGITPQYQYPDIVIYASVSSREVEITLCQYRYPNIVIYPSISHLFDTVTKAALPTVLLPIPISTPRFQYPNIVIYPAITPACRAAVMSTPAPISLARFAYPRIVIYPPVTAKIHARIPSPVEATLVRFAYPHITVYPVVAQHPAKESTESTGPVVKVLLTEFTYPDIEIYPPIAHISSERSTEAKLPGLKVSLAEFVYPNITIYPAIAHHPVASSTEAKVWKAKEVKVTLAEFDYPHMTIYPPIAHRSAVVSTKPQVSVAKVTLAEFSYPHLVIYPPLKSTPHIALIRPRPVKIILVESVYPNLIVYPIIPEPVVIKVHLVEYPDLQVYAPMSTSTGSLTTPLVVDFEARLLETSAAARADQSPRLSLARIDTSMIPSGIQARGAENLSGQKPTPSASLTTPEDTQLNTPITSRASPSTRVLPPQKPVPSIALPPTPSATPTPIPTPGETPKVNVPAMSTPPRIPLPPTPAGPERTPPRAPPLVRSRSTPDGGPKVVAAPLVRTPPKRQIGFPTNPSSSTSSTTTSPSSTPRRNHTSGLIAERTKALLEKQAMQEQSSSPPSVPPRRLSRNATLSQVASPPQKQFPLPPPRPHHDRGRSIDQPARWI